MGCLLAIATAMTLIVSLILPRDDASAQVAWDAPLLSPPDAQPGIGLYLVETAGGELGAMTTWRKGQSPHHLGWRVGVAEGPVGRLNAYAGADVSGTWRRATADLPLDLAWIGGLGMAAGDYFILSIPFGVTAGRTLLGDTGIRFIPYFSPRLILDATFGRDAAEGDTGDPDGVDLDITLDLGFDVSFPNYWSLRFGATVGDREGLALGIAFH
jgi:hypothetical protein